MYKYYSDGKTLLYIGTFKNNELINSKCYDNHGLLCKDGNLKFFNKKYVLNGYGKEYHLITIQQGEFGNDSPYSISAFLRDDPTGKTIEEINNEEINPDNKIYTLEREKENPDKRIITFYGNVIGLDRDIQINIDENNIVTLQTIDGKSTELTKNEKNKN